MKAKHLLLTSTVATLTLTVSAFAAGPPAGVPVGPPAGVPLGPPAGIPSGPPAGIPVGPPAGIPSGPPAGVPVGPPAGIPSGPPAGISAGPPAGIPVGPPAGVPAGPPSGVSGPDNGVGTDTAVANAASDLGNLNAMHASSTAFDHAASNSIVGAIATYKSAMDAALQLTGQDEIDAITAARQQLALSANKQLTADAITQVDAQLGIVGANPSYGTTN